MAKRYAMPASASGMIKDGSPMLLNLREQSVNDTNKMAPNPYSLWEGVRFTALPWQSAAVPLPDPTPRAKPQFVGLSPERAAVPRQAELSRSPRRCHRKDP